MKEKIIEVLIISVVLIAFASLCFYLKYRYDKMVIKEAIIESMQK
jgi:hypothetical protein